MEKISVASAMDWSIELEKGLRSKKPGASVEAILKVGPRIEQWNRERQLTLAAYSMFGLVPGEDKLFANSILLRLAEAFRSGDRETRLSVVKIFLSYKKNRKSKRSSSRVHDEILSKSRVENPLELLTRVKTVFDTGDVESRAFSLILFGCWADFAKDYGDILYVILTSLVSSHVLEVKASLFAAGCFCELSDDFAYVVLKILIDMTTSSKTVPSVRLAAVGGFTKLGCSSSLANKAYKAGTKLILESSGEDFLIAMLKSLSKLASKSTLLISEQVELLFSYLTQETTLRIQATTLRCLHFLLAKGVFYFPVSAHTVKTLFSLLDKPQISSAVQYEVLWILHKIVFYRLPDLLCGHMLELSELVMNLEDASRSPVLLNRCLAIRILVTISGKLRGRTELECGEVFSSLPSRVISLIMDRITLLVKQAPDCGQTEMAREAQSLLILLLNLAEEHSDLCVLLLDYIHSIMVTVQDRVSATIRPCLLAQEIVESKVTEITSVRSKLALYIYHFLLACLEILSESSAMSSEILQKVKLLVKQVHQCSLFDWYTHALYSLLLHSYITWDFMTNGNRETYKLDTIGVNYMVDQENLLECAKKMLSQNDNWSTYKAGIHAACQGAWLMAAFIFEQLITKVQSSSCFDWLKFLAQFAHSEREIHLLLLPNITASLVASGEEFSNIAEEDAQNVDLFNCSEKLVRAYSDICSSREALEASASSGEAFYFQRWFLTLRIKVLETMLHILKFLGTFPLNKDKNSNKGWEERSIDFPKGFQEINSSTYFLAQISHRLMRLAQELDLIAMSFIGMDRKSLKVITALALSCSLLAFSTGFALFVPRVPANEIMPSAEELKQISHVMLIQNLIYRLQHVDHETCVNLRSLLELTKEPEGCFLLPSRNQILNSSSEARDIVQVCSFAVGRVVHLQSEANRVHKEMLSGVPNDGLQLLSDIIKKWICIPFQTPKSFFQLRPCIGSELFAISKDAGNPDSISALAGFHLSLNLCLQLKNVPLDLQIRVTKLYCILCCKPSFQIPCSNEENKGQTWFDNWETDDLVDMNGKLLQYATKCMERTNFERRKGTDKEEGQVNAFVCFEPNERGQGFSTCLLDVSGFPAGGYRIRWLGGCIDNQGLYWSLLPLNAGPVLRVQNVS